MANTRSAKKRIKQNLKRRLRNRAVRSTIRSSVKTARAAVTEKTPQAKEAVLEGIRILDRAVSRGIIHRNTATRKKSALARPRGAARCRAAPGDTPPASLAVEAAAGDVARPPVVPAREKIPEVIVAVTGDEGFLEGPPSGSLDVEPEPRLELARHRHPGRAPDAHSREIG